MAAIKTAVPIISFSFDDAPRSAFYAGSEILMSHGARSTFYVSLGLLGTQTEVGPIASRDDLVRAVQAGDEIGCHTFDHLDAWQTSAVKFIESVEKNKQEIGRILPGTTFKTFSYPINDPRPSLKSKLEKYFDCCRGGGQTANVGMADLNLLKAYFLDKRNRNDINSVRRVIDYNASCRGWLIFATHDVSDNPTSYGCTRKLFADVVEYAARSGASILPVGKAWERLRASNSEAASSK